MVEVVVVVAVAVVGGGLTWSCLALGSSSRPKLSWRSSYLSTSLIVDISGDLH